MTNATQQQPYSRSAWEAYRAIFANIELDKHAKLVLVALVSQLPPTGLYEERFASAQRLATMTGLSRTTVKSVMTNLCNKGYISTRPDFDGNGRQRANLYRLSPSIFAGSGKPRAAAGRLEEESSDDRGRGRRAATMENIENNKNINTTSCSTCEKEEVSDHDPSLNLLLNKAAKAFGRPIGIEERRRFTENMRISGFSIDEAERELTFLANHPSGRRNTFSVNRIFDPGAVRAQCAKLDKTVRDIVIEAGSDAAGIRERIRDLARAQADWYDSSVFEKYYVEKHVRPESSANVH